MTADRGAAGLLVGAAVAAVVVVGGSASAWQLTTSSGPVYRLAQATEGSVAQTLDVTGTIEPVSESTLSFQVAGTVAAVDVVVGQHVSAGQTLATLDTSSLASALSADQSALSTDQAKLTSDEQSQASQSSQTSNPSGSQSTGSGIAKAQQQLVADQKTSDTDSAQAKTDLQAADSDCQGGSPSTCSADLAQSLADQQLVSHDLAQVAQEEDVLSGLLQQEASSLAQSAGNSGRGAAGNSGVGTVTAATIATDQAQIDSEQASLDQAQQQMDDATLASPLAGEVAQVSMRSGDSVTAGSSTEVIVVQGPDSFAVVASVSTTDLAALRVGQSASVVADGTSSSVPGTVSSINSLPVGSSGSDQITVSLPAGTPGLYNGANAEVSVVTGMAEHALTVPTSALVERGNLYFVNVVTAGVAKLVPVQVGAIGATVTQINSGLAAGAQVELADLNQPLPSANANSPRSIISLEGGGGVTFFRGGPGGQKSVSVGP